MKINPQVNMNVRGLAPLAEADLSVNVAESIKMIAVMMTLILSLIAQFEKKKIVSLQ